MRSIPTAMSNHDSVTRLLCRFTTPDTPCHRSKTHPERLSQPHHIRLYRSIDTKLLQHIHHSDKAHQPPSPPLNMHLTLTPSSIPPQMMSSKWFTLRQSLSLPHFRRRRKHLRRFLHITQLIRRSRFHPQCRQSRQMRTGLRRGFSMFGRRTITSALGSTLGCENGF